MQHLHPTEVMQHLLQSGAALYLHWAGTPLLASTQVGLTGSQSQVLAGYLEAQQESHPWGLRSNSMDYQMLQQMQAQRFGSQHEAALARSQSFTGSGGLMRMTSRVRLTKAA